MTLDTPTLMGLVAISGATSVVVEGAKRVWRALAFVRGWQVHDDTERTALRILGVIVGCAAVLAWMGTGIVEASVGMLTGASSEVVYRWLLSRLPGVLEGVR